MLCLVCALGERMFPFCSQQMDVGTLSVEKIKRLYVSSLSLVSETP